MSDRVCTVFCKPVPTMRILQCEIWHYLALLDLALCWGPAQACLAGLGCPTSWPSGCFLLALQAQHGCIFGGINFFKVLWFFISFNCFLLDFNGFNWFKLLFGPIRLEIHQVSAQMVDSRPESWHFWNFNTHTWSRPLFWSIWKVVLIRY